MKFLRLLWDNVFKYCKALIILVIISSSVYAMSLIPIWIQKVYIDRLQQFLTGNYALIPLIWWLILLYVTRTVSGGVLIPCAAAKDLYYEYIVTRNVRRSQHRMNNSIRLEYYNSKTMYELMERAGTALTSGALRDTVNAVASFLTMSISLISILISLWVIHPAFLILAIIIILPMFLEYFWFQKRIYEIDRSLITEKRRQQFCIDHISGIDYFFQTRLSGSATHFVNEWERYRHNSEKLRNQVYKRKILFSLLSGFVISGCVVGMIIFGTYLLSIQYITIGAFSALIGIIGMMVNYMDFFISTLSQSIVKIGELKEISRYYEMEQELKEEDPPSTVGNITLEDVAFQYESRSTLAVEGIKKTFQKGEKIAVLGINGAGKTTLMNLIMGLYTPTKGRVLYNGIDISFHDKTKWHERFTAVFQDYQIYNVSIADNVFLADTRKEKNMDEIMKSLNWAGFPSDKWESVDVQIGRAFNGIELSGGEAQKLAIARSYYNSDAEVIVIDEPTAALDPNSEELLYQSFLKNTDGKILFIVSHRLGSVKLATRILVMDNSKILEDGSHEQLLEQNGLYAKMYREQATLYNR